MTAENIALALWLTFIAVCILAFYLLADAATLSMTGSCTGQLERAVSLRDQLITIEEGER